MSRASPALMSGVTLHATDAWSQHYDLRFLQEQWKIWKDEIYNQKYQLS